MQNHSDSSRERYRAPERPMEMDGAAIPRFTPLTPHEDWYWRLNPTVPPKEVTHSLLVPISLKGTESVGGLFHYTVRAKTDLRAPWTLDTTLDLDTIVGTEVTVLIDIPGRGTFIPGMPGDTGRGNIGFHVREITGRVSTARFIERNDRVMVYEFVLEPTLKKAAMGQNYRIVQNKTVIDAIRELLADYPVSIDWRIAGPIHGEHYPVRNLQRQHFESDFTCFMRWCERAGLFFWFEHSKGFHRLVIADTMGAFKPHGEAYRTLRYAPGENRIDEECIEWLELDSHWTEGKVTVVDHDPMQPRMRPANTPLLATSDDPRETAEADQEFYEHGVNVSQPLQGAMGLNGRPLDNDEQARQAAMVRMQSIRCQGMRIRGSGHLRGLRPGYTFELTEHPLATANQEWLVLSVKLDIECNDQASGTEQVFRCDCEFEAQPAKGCHFRLPVVTPWPVIGAERAIVTGPEGNELWTDGQGRICVQLVADRAGKYDNDSFIWLWPAQPWQNGRASSVFLPRVGSEVVVEHINGNPDMPYVAGGLGNKDNPPPWDLAKNMWLTGIRTRESGGSGSNHLVFDDTHGRQQVQLATDAAKTGAHFGNIRRVDDDTGLQEPRGLGAEVRTDGFMALRAALGGMFTTFARLLAKGKIKENGEAVALLTAARDIHENATQLAQQRGAQEPGRDQSDAVKAIKTANDELRGSANPRAGAEDFPEFERPHLLLASAAGIQAAATDDLHLSSGRHLATSATGHVSIAAGKSLVVSVLEKIAFYAQETIRLISTGPVHAESRNSTMTLMSQDDMTVTSTQGRVDINAPKGINLRCNNTLVSLRPDGFYVYTNGQHLIHAAGHATADPQGQPVQFPVTPDSPGKFAAHHVLVENQGGFAIPNQPYRMTLDDGRVISGVTNELGEMASVTSNATMFGMIELMSQSEPDHVVGLVSTTVYQDASLPPPPNAVAPAQTMQVGNKTVSTPQTGATSTGNVPAFLSCDPMNFGLRTYRFIGSAKADISLGLSRKDVEYPVAKAYTAAVKKTLTAIDWKALRTMPLESTGDAVRSAVEDALDKALQSGAFGLPKASLPTLVVVQRGNTQQYGFDLDGTEAAVFAARRWLMAIADPTINILFNMLDKIDAADTEVKKQAAARNFDARLRDLANSIYHEARHCQQSFWMMSLYSTYLNDYKQFPGIAVMFETSVLASARKQAESTPFPKDDLAKIGVHRMLIFQYWWFIVVNRENGSTYEPWKPIFADADKVQAEVAKMRGVTLEQALQMGQRKDPGYRTHYHEEDAFATEIAVTQYWDNPDHADLVNPGTCTRHYRKSLEEIGVNGNG